MDTELLRTFIEVHQARHFGRAADNLFLTPSAVSARIRLLESQLDAQLFVRERNNLQLTPAGIRLLGYARSILRLTDQTRLELRALSSPAPSLALLAMPSLWETHLVDWVCSLRAAQPDLLLRAAATDTGSILRRLQQGEADLGLLFETLEGPDLAQQQIGEMALRLVATRPYLTAEAALATGYVSVDWNSSFAGTHASLYPAAPPPSTWVTSGPLARRLLLQGGGAAYLPEPLVHGDLEANRLFLVNEAQPLRLPLFAVYAVWNSQEQRLRELIADLQTTLESAVS